MKNFGYKESIRELLEIISYPAKRAGIGSVEIICGWFDDLYLPADDPGLYNPGVLDKSVKDFESCFSKDELFALQSFHEFFSSVVEDLISDEGNINIKDDPTWIKVGIMATKTLETFE